MLWCCCDTHSETLYDFAELNASWDAGSDVFWLPPSNVLRWGPEGRGLAVAETPGFYETGTDCPIGTPGDFGYRERWQGIWIKLVLDLKPVNSFKMSMVWRTLAGGSFSVRSLHGTGWGVPFGPLPVWPTNFSSASATWVIPPGDGVTWARSDSPELADIINENTFLSANTKTSYLHLFPIHSTGVFPRRVEFGDAPDSPPIATRS